ncbi:hypothetical protein O9929_12850 [Vibrio lentus]|nr:hypothetical protein [Vibrio lentus]
MSSPSLLIAGKFAVLLCHYLFVYIRCIAFSLNVSSATPAVGVVSRSLQRCNATTIQLDVCRAESNIKLFPDSCRRQRMQCSPSVLRSIVFRPSICCVTLQKLRRKRRLKVLVTLT